MKKNIKLGLLIMATGLVLASCASRQLVSVEADTVEGPRQVRQGQSINPNDITVWGNYKDGSRKLVSISQSNIIFDNRAPGPQTVRVRIGNYEASFQTEVVALTGITIASPPTKTLFKVGEESSPSWPGLEIRGEWGQMGSDRIATASCQITGFNKDRAGRQTISVAYEGQTTTFNVEVLALVSLTVVSPPTKTLFKVGEDSSPSWPGLEVQGTWNQIGSERIPTASLQITGFNKDRAGRQAISVAYGGQTVTFNVEVVALTSLTVVSPPTKTLFKVGEDASSSWPGLEVQGTWSQIGIERIPTASLQITGFNKDRAGRQAISVAYGGQTTTFNVDVLALSGVDLDKPPDKTDYVIGEPMDLAGIILYGNYGTNPSNRIRELIPANQLTVSGYDASRVGNQQRVTVTVGGQSAYFFVNVTQAPVTPPPASSSNYVEMIRVAGGSFQMGSASGVNDDERPVHRVTLTGFYIGKYEVTQAQWQAVMGRTIQQHNNDFGWGLSGVGGNQPMYYVNWYDALVFCNKLSMAEGLTPAYRISGSTDPAAWGNVPTGRGAAAWDAVTIVSGSTGYRLPTEAQWEYAARGGNGSPGGFTYAGSGNLDEVAWYHGNSDETTHPVGTKAPNGLGLYDMTGNVAEWCWDWVARYSSDAQTNPSGPSSPSGPVPSRMTRGGGWGDSDYQATSTRRGSSEPSAISPAMGLRLVRPE